MWKMDGKGLKRMNGEWHHTVQEWHGMKTEDRRIEIYMYNNRFCALYYTHYTLRETEPWIICSILNACEDVTAPWIRIKFYRILRNRRSLAQYTEISLFLFRLHFRARSLPFHFIFGSLSFDSFLRHERNPIVKYSQDQSNRFQRWPNENQSHKQKLEQKPTKLGGNLRIHYRKTDTHTHKTDWNQCRIQSSFCIFMIFAFLSMALFLFASVSLFHSRNIRNTHATYRGCLSHWFTHSHVSMCSQSTCKIHSRNRLSDSRGICKEFVLQHEKNIGSSLCQRTLNAMFIIIIIICECVCAIMC